MLLGLRRKIDVSSEVAVHELSIVSSIVDSVTETLEAYPGARVKEVRLRVGALAVGRRRLAAVLLRHRHRWHPAGRLQAGGQRFSR